jgi:nitrogen regulatory protein P-II 1
MKKIDATIKPFKLEDVKNALDEVGIRGITITEVRDFGGQKGQKQVFRGNEYAVDFLPKIKIEVVLTDDQLDPAVTAIVKAAQTDTTGDGNIFVSSVEEVVRIRGREKGVAAL